MCGLQLERAYTGMQRHNKAMEVAIELNRLYPEDPEVLYHTGRLFGNFAFLTMQTLAQVAPGSVWRHQAAAEAFESQDSYDLAVREYRTVLQLGPGRPGIHFRLGRTLDRKSTRLNSSHGYISYAGFCFKQKNKARRGCRPSCAGYQHDPRPESSDLRPDRPRSDAAHCRPRTRDRTGLRVDARHRRARRH